MYKKQKLSNNNKKWNVGGECEPVDINWKNWKKVRFMVELKVFDESGGFEPFQQKQFVQKYSAFIKGEK